MNSFLSWVGGKRLLRKQITDRFPKEIDRYVEVFGGAAWVLFYKDKHAKQEIYNDLDGNLVNLFRCVKHHTPEMQRLLREQLTSREMFDQYLYLHRQTNPFQTDIQRAVEFYTLIKTSYGSKGQHFNLNGETCNFERLANTLTPIQKRLQNVVIEHSDFAKLIARYDKPGTLFYCDPPYYQAEYFYNIHFTPDDHQRLRDTLATIQGKFLLSYNDHPAIRELYQTYNIEPIERNNNLVSSYSNASKNYQELIITNY